MKTFIIIFCCFILFNTNASIHLENNRRVDEKQKQLPKRRLGQKIREKVAQKLLKIQERKLKKRIVKGKKAKGGGIALLLFFLYVLFSIGLVVWAVLSLIAGKIILGFLGFIAIIFVPILFVLLIMASLN